MISDPFADNILSDPESGELSAFIDIEDVCVGPLLFDLACCVIGCCCLTTMSLTAGKYSQVIDFALLSALLEGYYTDRKLPALEVKHFVASIHCIALWHICVLLCFAIAAGDSLNLTSSRNKTTFRSKRRILTWSYSKGLNTCARKR